MTKEKQYRQWNRDKFGRRITRREARRWLRFADQNRKYIRRYNANNKAGS